MDISGQTHISGGTTTLTVDGSSNFNGSIHANDISSNSTITANTGFVGKLQTEEQPNVTTMTGLQHIGNNGTNINLNSNVKINNNLTFDNDNDNAPLVTIDMNSRTDGIILPKGEDDTRPIANGQDNEDYIGTIRYNTKNKQFEGFGAGNAWGSLGGVKDINGDTYITTMDVTTNEDRIKFYVGEGGADNNGGVSQLAMTINETTDVCFNNTIISVSYTHLTLPTSR